jgi:DNA-binding MarR family transcriptional regulator
MATEFQESYSAVEMRAQPAKWPSAPDVCVVLRRASRAVTHLYDLVLAPTGLKATQVMILQAIREHGEIAQCHLAGTQGMSVGSLSRRLAALRKAGLICLQVDSGGRHQHRYALSDAGRLRLQHAEPYWLRAQQRLRSAGSVADWPRVLDAALQVTQAAARAEAAKQVNLPVHAPAAAGCGTYPSSLAASLAK